MGSTTDAPTAMIVHVSWSWGSLHVLTMLPNSAASFPLINTVGAVPELTVPSPDGVEVNFTPGGIGTCPGGLCVLTESAVAAGFPFTVTSDDNPSVSFPR